jgi:very-short-patch-repair endonuclease
LGRGGLRDRARTLRKNQTDAEIRLWKLLRAKRLDSWKFRRQYPIGSYIVDFACPSARLIVEADGSQHAENGYDVRRDAWLASQGWRVIRFWNNHILNDTESVLTAVYDALSAPLPNPSPTRGEGLSGDTRG